MRTPHRRNPDAAPAKPKVAAPVKRSSGGGIKNWLILGGAGFGAYYLYKKFNSAKVQSAISQAASGHKIAAPDLNGPLVTKFEIASTKTPNCISARAPGFVYSPVSSTNPLTGYSTFSATVTGHFTRRVLCSGGQRVAAEIKPTAGLSGLMALGDLAKETARRLD